MNPLEVYHTSLESICPQKMGLEGLKHLGNLPHELRSAKIGFWSVMWTDDRND